MDELTTVALIDAVQPQKALWLKSDNGFKDKAKKEVLWQKIAEDIGADGAFFFLILFVPCLLILRLSSCL